MSEDCVFCDLNYERTRILFDSRYNMVILSNPALVHGHCLVIPKRHVEKLSELSPDEREDLWLQVERLYDRLLKIYGRGCDVRHHYRPFQIQSNLKVDHLHIHLQPRKLYDELYQKCQINENEIFRNLESQELDDIRGEILI